MTAPQPNPNFNNLPPIDPNDPYAAIPQDQPILRDPESDIIAKAMQYYNTEATELSGQTNPPKPLTQAEAFPTKLFNHDYHDGVNPQAETQLNNLYQQSALGRIEPPAPIANNQVPEIAVNPAPDATNVYESVTYPEANFQNYKSVYNPIQPNPEVINEIPVNSDDYPSSILVTTEVQSNQDQFDPNTVIPEPKSRRLVWIIVGLVLVSLFIGLGAYTWWIATQRGAVNDGSATSSSSLQSTPDTATTSAESSRSTRSVSVVFNDPNGPKPAEIAKKDSVETLVPDFIKQNFDATKVAEDKCLDDSICGKDVDPDKDGLTNIQEQAYRTNPNKADSDDDKIADGDEVNIYGTDPTKSDSTNSGYSDFDKVKACNDPAFQFTNIPNKFSPEREKQITENINKFKLQETTINSLKAIGATDNDIKNGTLAESCSPINFQL